MAATASQLANLAKARAARAAKVKHHTPAKAKPVRQPAQPVTSKAARVIADIIAPGFFNTIN
jgi:hypothetical protein